MLFIVVPTIPAELKLEPAMLSKDARHSMRRETLLTEKNIRLVFEASLIFKGLFALLEIIGGVAVYWVSQHALLDLVQAKPKPRWPRTRATWSPTICCISHRICRLARSASQRFIY